MATTTGNMNFIDRESVPNDEKPYLMMYQPAHNIRTSNFKWTPVKDVPLHDMRPRMETLSLDKEGFIVAKLESRLSYEELLDAEKLRSVYAEEVRKLVLEKLGARSAYIHECVIRKRGESTPIENNGYGQPVNYVHSDYTLEYIERLITQLVGEKASVVTSKRYVMLNVWKPLKGPVRDWPLAICDLQSLDGADMYPLDEVHPTDLLESYLFAYTERQRWYFLSDQDTTEAIIFKDVDSAMPGEVPHSAFQDPRWSEADPRESIECRVLVAF